MSTRTAISLPKPAAEGQIRSARRPICAVCGGTGTIVYAEQRDRLFGAPGAWDFKECSNSKCGLVWLDPMPLTEDLGKAYAKYYTHASPDWNSGGGTLKRIYRLMKRGYWLGKYNYPGPASAKAFGKILYLFPVRRNDMDSEARYLEAIPGGRVLDVGCGSGDWLRSMRDLGWKAEGIDFDENAVKTARQSGLEVGCGALEQQNFPDESFDAVTLNHVIEHVPDPVGTLAECHRILKKGGKLVLFTPNAASLSRKVFKNDWRGWEPPRHLHVFSSNSLPVILKRAGFDRVSLRPQIAKSVICESILLRRTKAGSTAGTHRSRSILLRAALFNLAEVMVLNWNKSAADCVAAIAVKE